MQTDFLSFPLSHHRLRTRSLVAVRYGKVRRRRRVPLKQPVGEFNRVALNTQLKINFYTIRSSHDRMDVFDIAISLLECRLRSRMS